MRALAISILALHQLFPPPLLPLYLPWATPLLLLLLRLPLAPVCSFNGAVLHFLLSDSSDFIHVGATKCVYHLKLFLHLLIIPLGRCFFFVLFKLSCSIGHLLFFQLPVFTMLCSSCLARLAPRTPPLSVSTPTIASRSLLLLCSIAPNTAIRVLCRLVEAALALSLTTPAILKGRRRRAICVCSTTPI
jgi:hypothetical protein